MTAADPNVIREARIEIPAEYLPDGVSGSSMDLVVMRAAAEAHCRTPFTHDMTVKAWSVLYLLDCYAELAAVRADLAEAQRELGVYEAFKNTCPLCGLHPHDFTVDEYKRELDRAEAALAEAREALRRIADETHDGLDPENPCSCEACKVGRAVLASEGGEET